MTSKRLAVFLDGTWNDVDANTNVWRLRSLVAEQGGGIQQRVYYHAGVGTDPDERLLGGAFGYGLSGEVVRAYRWLIEQFEVGDDIFIFGFSRGAYTARSLAGLIATCGLLQPGAPLSVEEIYERYRDPKARPIWKLDYLRSQGEKLTEAEQRVLDYSCRQPIRMLGVWDTVGTLGVPIGNWAGISRSAFKFHNTRLSNIYHHAFQALGIDEHRHDFAPSLWTRYTPDVPDPVPAPPHGLGAVEQRWFCGCHCNVGGGYRNNDMSQRPLAWLKEKAEALGLAFRFPVTLTGREHLEPVVDSYAEFAGGWYKVWKLWRRYDRVIGAPARKVTGGTSEPVNETIDGSVFERWRAEDKKYRPKGLVEWAARRAVDPATIQGTIDARTLQAVPPLASSGL